MFSAPSRRVTVLIAVAVATAAGLAVWSLASRSSPSPPVVTDRAEVAALCDAVASARGGDLEAAYGVFLSRAHTPLHELAAAAAARHHRAVAARLLEAKAAAEASLPVKGETAGEDLEALLAATRDAAALVNGRRPPPCPEEGTR